MAAEPDETAREAERDGPPRPGREPAGTCHPLEVSQVPRQANTPPPSQMGRDSLALGYSEGGGAGRSICIGPSVNTPFLQVIS